MDGLAALLLLLREASEAREGNMLLAIGKSLHRGLLAFSVLTNGVQLPELAEMIARCIFPLARNDEVAIVCDSSDVIEQAELLLTLHQNSSRRSIYSAPTSDYIHTLNMLTFGDQAFLPDFILLKPRALASARACALADAESKAFALHWLRGTTSHRPEDISLRTAGC